MPDDEGTSMDLGEGVALEMPATPTPMNPNQLQRGRPRPRAPRPALPEQHHVRPAIAVKDEPRDRSLVRRLLEALRLRTQGGFIFPDQCLGCAKQHLLGIRNSANAACNCVCHEARQYLAEIDAGEAEEAGRK